MSQCLNLRHCYNVSQDLDKCKAETSLSVLPGVCINGHQGTDLDEVWHAKKKMATAEKTSLKKWIRLLLIFIAITLSH